MDNTNQAEPPKHPQFLRGKYPQIIEERYFILVTNLAELHLDARDTISELWKTYETGDGSKFQAQVIELADRIEHVQRALEEFGVRYPAPRKA